MKPKTIPHYKVYRHIEQRFHIGADGVRVSEYDTHSLKVSDSEGAGMVFRLEDGQVVAYEMGSDGQLIRYQYPLGHPDYELGKE